jgi:predicted amidophosphoribosyltransferase
MDILSIICPHCEAELDAAANRCARCGAPTRTSDSSAETDKPRGSLMERPWMLAIIILHLGLFGIPLYWKMNFSKNTRIVLVTTSILYTAFAALVIAWGLRQIWKMIDMLTN